MWNIVERIIKFVRSFYQHLNQQRSERDAFWNLRTFYKPIARYFLVFLKNQLSYTDILFPYNRHFPYVYELN